MRREVWRRRELNSRERNICREVFAAEMMMYFWVSMKSVAFAAWLWYAQEKHTGVPWCSCTALVLLRFGQLCEVLASLLLRTGSLWWTVLLRGGSFSAQETLQSSTLTKYVRRHKQTLTSRSVRVQSWAIRWLKCIKCLKSFNKKFVHIETFDCRVLDASKFETLRFLLKLYMKCVKQATLFALH